MTCVKLRSTYMHRAGSIVAVVVLASLAARLSADPVDHVNPLIGSGDGSVGYGGTMPFVGPPFAMTNWTAQSRQNRPGVVSYRNQDQTISGFIGTHQPAICMGDYGYVTIIPELDSVKTTPESRQMPFSHVDEVATPYYYSVLTDGGRHRKIRTEIAATDHAAIPRFTFPANRKATLAVEATRPGIKGRIRFDAARNELSGYNPDRWDALLGPFALPNFRGYFVVQFQKRPLRHGTYPGTHIRDGSSRIEENNAGGYVSYKTTENAVIETRIGTSFISVEQARANLREEIPGWDFDSVCAKTKKLWNEKLGMFALEGASHDQVAIFYTRSIMRCSILCISPNTDGTTAPSMTRFMTENPTLRFQLGTLSAPNTAC